MKIQNELGTHNQFNGSDPKVKTQEFKVTFVTLRSHF